MAYIRWDGPLDKRISFASNDSVMEEVELGVSNDCEIEQDYLGKDLNKYHDLVPMKYCLVAPKLFDVGDRVVVHICTNKRYVGESGQILSWREAKPGEYYYDVMFDDRTLGRMSFKESLLRLALNSNYGVNPTNYYFVGGRGNGKSFESLKRYLEILQQPSSITVSKDCIPEINYNACRDDFPEINIDSIRRMMKEEEFKMKRSRFKLGDKVVFFNITSLNVNSLYSGSVYMVTGVAYDLNRDRYVYEITRERFDGTTVSFSNISQCDLVPYTDYASRSKYTASDVNTAFTFMNTLKTCNMEISKVIFNPPATIVFWKDNGKTVVKCGEGDTFDQEKGLAMAICKRLFGSNKSGSDYYDGFNEIFEAMKSNDPEKAIAMKLIEKRKGKKYFKDICKKYCNESKPVVKEQEEPKKDNNPCTDCPDRKKGCLTNCEKMQEFVNDIQDTEASPKPIEPGYFVKHAEERKNKPKAHATSPVKNEIPVLNINFDPKSIAHFVEKFDATMFPSNFLAFCKKNNLYFFIVDKLKGGMKAIDPYTTNWQQVTRYLKSGVMESCMKMKDHNINNSFLAVDMDKALFAKLPVELRGENRKEV